MNVNKDKKEIFQYLLPDDLISKISIENKKGIIILDKLNLFSNFNSTIINSGKKNINIQIFKEKHKKENLMSAFSLFEELRENTSINPSNSNEIYLFILSTGDFPENRIKKILNIYKGHFLVQDFDIIDFINQEYGIFLNRQGIYCLLEYNIKIEHLIENEYFFINFKYNPKNEHYKIGNVIELNSEKTKKLIKDLYLHLKNKGKIEEIKDNFEKNYVKEQLLDETSKDDSLILTIFKEEEEKKGEEEKEEQQITKEKLLNIPINWKLLQKTFFKLKPAFIVDLKYFEFKYLLENLYEINLEIIKRIRTGEINCSSFKEIEKIRRAMFKKRALEDVGQKPMDLDKDPRNLKGSKEKIVDNFKIFFSNLSLFQNPHFVEYLVNALKKNESIFKEKLIDFLIDKGKWDVIIFTIMLILLENPDLEHNKIIFKKKISEYLFLFYSESFPDLKQKRWQKQVAYVWHWIEDLDLINYSKDLLFSRSIKEKKRIEKKIFVRKRIVKGNTTKWILEKEIPLEKNNLKDSK